MPNLITLRVSEEAWRVLEETLRMDAQSHAFDPELRDQITAALQQVEQVSSLQTVVPLVTASDLSDAVDELFNDDSATLLDQDGRPYSRGQVEHALAAWLGRLNETLLDHLADYALNGFRWTEMELPPCSNRDFEAEARGETADRAYERARERVAA
jgi:enoyl-CoA hydratase/carnithine racemase